MTSVNTSSRRSRLTSGSAIAAGLVLPLAILAGCSTSDSADGATATAESTEPEVTTTEAATVTPRLALTYDGGIQVLDATTLELVADIELDGFNRLNPTGDGHHVLVSTTGGFQVLDVGTWAEPHGEHAHYYTSDPILTDVVFAAEKPGHAVVHEGRTALFDDATGNVTVLDSSEIAEPDAAELREYTTPTAHHGVAVELDDGTLVVSEGTEDARTGIRVLDADDDEIAASDQCPGVHGEAVAADDAVVIGCEDGAVVYSGGAITKVQSPDSYGRIGNQAGSEASAVVLGDYKSDPDAELERPTRISLIDTRTSTVQLVDLPSSYSFRSLGRGDDGEALVLGTDGQLHVIDPETGVIERSIPVVSAWEEPDEWQSPRPTLIVLDGSAYITDPSTNTISAVDILTGEVWVTAELTVTPNELTSASGAVEAGAHAEDEHAEDEHEHDEDEDEHDDHTEAPATS
ncbi:zinc metallochaperone AztD [Sanguibacter antarcticus]|uniref:Pyrroloquinoline-quinone binding quinoprotein n=1 Tax=Sanguibacter antarcticus TaxID=372484 RepID=A0A2A9E2D9_9MICO|nr:zinc metallochaperone AztD [Sanguibacter antarcticus]PFG33207.1 hypothetical protein ATL42_1067 [Sanguibacter antarcticus]